ncbi:TPA: DNA cytosine methyltransferase [Neisseria gonorrhoeae]
MQVLAGIDYELSCKETYEANINAKFIQADIFELQPETLEKELGLKKNDDDLILIGCSPCQYWSVIQTDKRKSEKSKSLLLEFQRFVEYFNPGYVVVENVPGILSRMKESGLDNFIKLLEEKGFTVHFGIHNTADYGIPQSRKRFTLIANRITKKSWNQSSIRANSWNVLSEKTIVLKTRSVGYGGISPHLP